MFVQARSDPEKDSRLAQPQSESTIQCRSPTKTKSKARSRSEEEFHSIEGTGLSHFVAGKAIQNVGFRRAFSQSSADTFTMSFYPLRRVIVHSWGPVAQRLEQQTHNLLVVGSNPTGPTTKPKQELYLRTEMLEARIA